MQQTETKRKPGRPRKNPEPEGRSLHGVPLPENSNKLPDNQDLLQRKDTGPRITPGMSGKCFEIQIFKKEGESNVVFVQPATFGPFWIRREARVIVPEEVVEALNSANSSMIPISDWDNPREDWSIPLVDVPYIRFPFQVYGEKTWAEYTDFKTAQAKRPVSPEKRR